MTSDGRIWKCGDDVNTDLIIPGRYLDNYDPSHLASHAMEGIDADFSKRVSPGDVIVAGRNFGCGSSREQAVTALRSCGVRAVVAESFARIFYRNSITLGLLVYESKEARCVFEDGDEAVIDAANNFLSSADGSKKAILMPIPPRLKEVLDCGGLLPYLKNGMQQPPRNPE